MKTLNEYISEKLIVNKKNKNVNNGPKSFDDIDVLGENPAHVLEIMFQCIKFDPMYGNSKNALDDDGWLKTIDIDLGKVEFIKKNTDKEYYIDYRFQSGGYRDDFSLDKNGDYLYNTKNESNKKVMRLIINPYNPNFIEGIDKLLKIYDYNEETKYTDHFASFKLSSDEMFELFGIDKERDFDKFDGNYRIILYKTKEVKYLNTVKKEYENA